MGAVDYFLKLGEIKGESKDKKHPDEIDLLSWSWGASQTGTSAAGGGAGAGKVSMQDFNFVMQVNKATPKLILACASGEHIPQAVLTCRKAGGEQEEFLKYTFSDVLVSSYQTGGSGGSDIVPTEQVSLNYTKMEVEYKEQTEKGTLKGVVKAGWDMKKNVKV
jgi:type VI secretion system secreted protein Hcp